MRIRQAHHRLLKSYLVENYQATDIHLESGGVSAGSHLALVFFAGGQRRQIITTERKDSRGVEHDIARIKKLLGEPTPKIRKDATSLEALTMTAEQEAHKKANGHANGQGGKRDLARRTIAGIGELPAPPKQPASPIAPEPIRPLNSVYATEIAIHGDDVSADYDLIFKTRKKQVTGDGEINVFHRPVALISIPRRTVLELADALAPVVQVLRPPPVTPEPDAATLNLTLGLTADGRFVQPSKPEKLNKEPRKSWADSNLIPKGYNAIMEMALRLNNARKMIIAETGARAGANYNRPMSQWLRDNGLTALDSRIRFDLNWIGTRADAVKTWAEGQPQNVLDNLVISSLIRRFTSAPALPPPPPKEEPATILEVQQAKTKVVKRSHHKKKPIETPKILEGQETATVETPKILEGQETPVQIVNESNEAPAPE